MQASLSAHTRKNRRNPAVKPSNRTSTNCANKLTYSEKYNKTKKVTGWVHISKHAYMQDL